MLVIFGLCYHEYLVNVRAMINLSLEAGDPIIGGGSVWKSGFLTDQNSFSLIAGRSDHRSWSP